MTFEAILDFVQQPFWSPYLVGIGIGILSWFTFLLSDHPLGVSTAFAKTAGMLEESARGEQVKEKPYYRQHKPVIDWEWMLVFGITLGAGLYAAIHTKIKDGLLKKGEFGDRTLIDVTHAPNPWVVAIPVAMAIVAGLFILESIGL